jgi:hypothetical protein
MSGSVVAGDIVNYLSGRPPVTTAEGLYTGVDFAAIFDKSNSLVAEVKARIKSFHNWVFATAPPATFADSTSGVNIDRANVGYHLPGIEIGKYILTTNNQTLDKLPYLRKPDLTGVSKDKDRVRKVNLHYLNSTITNNIDVHSKGAVIETPGDNESVYNPNGQLYKVTLTLAVTSLPVGRFRADTVLIRNLIFVVNLYRSIRLKLQRDLNYNRSAGTLSKEPSVRSTSTEMYGNTIVSQPNRDKYDPTSFRGSDLWKKYA